MPRLIDADALRADYFVASTTTNNPLYRYVSMDQIANAPTVEPASPWHRTDELPKEDGWYMLCFLSRWRDGNWWIPKFPDYWMDATPPKEDA